MILSEFMVMVGGENLVLKKLKKFQIAGTTKFKAI